MSRPRGCEDAASTWILIDAGDVLVHLFRAETRAFYDIEKLWSVAPPRRAAAAAAELSRAWSCWSSPSAAAATRRSTPCSPSMSAAAPGRSGLVEVQPRTPSRPSGARPPRPTCCWPPCPPVPPSWRWTSAAATSTSDELARQLGALARRGPARGGLPDRRRRTGSTERALAAAELRLAFGRQTWPHRLVRVMLAEQLYRATTILAGHPYHRAVTGGLATAPLSR